MESKKIKMTTTSTTVPNDFIIGPSNPDSFVLFNRNFYYQNKNYASLFHAGLGCVFNKELEHAPVEVVHEEFVKISKSNIINIICINCAFGTYSFKYHEDVKKALKRIPKDQHIYVEGLEKDQFRMIIIEDMRDEAHKSD